MRNYADKWEFFNDFPLYPL